MRHLSILKLLALLLVMALALVGASVSADAKKKKQSAEEKARIEALLALEAKDQEFAKGFIGKGFEGDLDIDGWSDVGGGIVQKPIFVRQYQREDGAFLVLTSK